MTWSVVGHGSWFAGVDDPHDVDVLVVSDQPIDKSTAAARIAPLLDSPRSLPLDVSVVHPDDLSVIERAIVHTGRLLDGADLTGDVAPVRTIEWAAVMSHLATICTAPATPQTAPGRGALAALRAIWAAAGRTVIPKSAVVAAAAGTRWESLAVEAWAQRHLPVFDHPDLADAVDAAGWAAAGEAVSAAYERRGWSSKQNRAAVLTVYRQVLTAAEIGRLDGVPATRRQTGGWKKDPVDEPALFDLFCWLVSMANIYWWHRPLAGLEPLEVHRHHPGTLFAAHVDRLPMFPTRAFNVVAMVRPAAAGGDLYLNLGGEPVKPALAPGDVAIFDSSYLHGVTAVDAGERVVVVSHAHAEFGRDLASDGGVTI